MKIDIVDLMDFYWNNAPVPDAQEEMLKQGGSKLVLKRETRRRRNRPLLAAVVMLLAVLIVMPFALPRITGDPAAVNAENAQPAETSDDYQTTHIAGLLVPSVVYPVALEIPAEYAAEIEVDTPYQDNPYGTPEGEIQFDNVVFSFYNKFSQAYDWIGLVWCITATPKNEYTPPDPMYYGVIFEYNQVELGTDENYVYTLIYPRASRQCNPDDPENVDSYFAHLAIGQDLLTQFIQQNSLQSDGAGFPRKNGCAILSVRSKTHTFTGMENML